MSGDRIGELLVRQKLISLQQLRKAQETQRKDGTSLGYALAKMGFVSDDQITDFLSSQYKVQAVDLREYEVDPDVLKLIPVEVCERRRRAAVEAHVEEAFFALELLGLVESGALPHHYERARHHSECA